MTACDSLQQQLEIASSCEPSQGTLNEGPLIFEGQTYLPIGCAKSSGLSGIWLVLSEGEEVISSGGFNDGLSTNRETKFLSRELVRVEVNSSKQIEITFCGERAQLWDFNSETNTWTPNTESSFYFFSSLRFEEVASNYMRVGLDETYSFPRDGEYRTMSSEAEWIKLSSVEDSQTYGQYSIEGFTETIGCFVEEQIQEKYTAVDAWEAGRDEAYDWSDFKALYVQSRFETPNSQLKLLEREGLENLMTTGSESNQVVGDIDINASVSSSRFQLNSDTFIHLSFQRE